MEHTILESKEGQLSKWYIVRTQANREKSVSEKIIKASSNELSGVTQVILPIEKTFHMKSGKKIKREKVLYPGYIFVKCSAVGELKFFLKECNGATGFLTNKSGDIQELSEIEVSRMIGIVEDLKNDTEDPFIVGEEIKITDGPFQTFLGTIEKIEGQKVKVSVSIFGRKTPLDLDVTQIDKK
jgi:transcriptional antiterminator NusG